MDADRFAQGLKAPVFRRQFLISRERALHLDCAGRVEFAIERGVQEKNAILVI
jgi:hypothetical protein